jgi:cytochrome c oxidase cbb3-type subunit 3
MYSNALRGLLLCCFVAPLLIFADQPEGEHVFSSSCAGCHGLDGRGGEHAPNIATDPKVQRLSDGDLLRIVRGGIPSAGMPAFSSSLDGNQLKSVVSYLRHLQGQNQTANVTGDAAKGRSLFFGAAGCSECHMMNGQGGFLGLDLSGYGSSHSPGQIRESILHPGKDGNLHSGTILVVTKSGREYTGIVRNEDNFTLQMQTRDGAFHLFEKSDLARIEHQSRSLMPSQSGSRLTETELNDLISYLATSSGSGGSAAHDDEEQ